MGCGASRNAPPAATQRSVGPLTRGLASIAWTPQRPRWVARRFRWVPHGFAALVGCPGDLVGCLAALVGGPICHAGCLNALVGTAIDHAGRPSAPVGRPGDPVCAKSHLQWGSWRGRKDKQNHTILRSCCVSFPTHLHHAFRWHCVIGIAPWPGLACHLDRTVSRSVPHGPQSASIDGVSPGRKQIAVIRM